MPLWWKHYATEQGEVELKLHKVGLIQSKAGALGSTRSQEMPDWEGHHLAGDTWAPLGLPALSSGLRKIMPHQWASGLSECSWKSSLLEPDQRWATSEMAEAQMGPLFSPFPSILFSHSPCGKNLTAATLCNNYVTIKFQRAPAKSS